MLCSIFRILEKNSALATAWDFCGFARVFEGVWKKQVFERGFLMVRTW
jgi:hypothetical protein